MEEVLFAGEVDPSNGGKIVIVGQTTLQFYRALFPSCRTSIA